MTQILIPRDFNIVVNDIVNLYGTLTSSTPGGVEVERKPFQAGGAMFDKAPIVGFKFAPLKFKVTAYPKKFDSLPIGQKLTMSWTEYLVDEADQSEVGIRHYYEGELDKPKEADRKRGDIPDWDYELKNMTVYRKYVDDVLIDEGNGDTGKLILNGAEVWGRRSQILQLGGA